MFRTPGLLFLVANLVFGISHTFAEPLKIKDVVSVIRETEMQSERETTTLMSIGTCLVVQAIDNERLLVAAGKVGWVTLPDVLPIAAAKAYFAEVIEQNPQDAVAYKARGKIWFHEGELDKSIEDLDKSIQLMPSSEAHTIRGWAWKRKGDKEKPMIHFDEAIRLDPKNSLAWRVRGATWAGLTNYERTLFNYNESIRLDPDNPDSLNHRALLLAACNDDQIRNGKQAIADATKACELTSWKNPLYIINLAVAYSEVDDFDAAIRWHSKAIELYTPEQVKSLSLQARLEQFQQHKPIRMTWK